MKIKVLYKVLIGFCFYLTTLKLVAEDTGKKIYDTYCFVCHTNGLAGAPKIQNKDEWEPRIQNKTITDLVEIVMQGLNVMPPMGTCSSCSKDDIKAAIEYMVPKK